MTDVTLVDPLDPAELSTQPRPPAPPALGVVGWLRWAWRTLTSMRTALILLFLLALAAVPGSVLPQRDLNPLRVEEYIADHGTLGPFLDRIGAFEVFASAWFAAIYLLLFLSLAGCVIPRSWRHAKAMSAHPPGAPSRLHRLPQSSTWQTALPVEEAYEAARSALRKRRFRVHRYDGALAAEKGYLKETGNLVFHLSLLVLLGGVALGHLYGFSANRLVIDGQGFSNAVGSYDTWDPGRFTEASSLTPFTIELEKFTASYVASGDRAGQAEDFNARVRYRAAPGEPMRTADIRVNHPLSFGGTKVYLAGHGYAPNFVVRDGNGRVVFDGPVPFLPQDGNFGSTGVVKVPDARPRQLAFSGFFLPTAVPSPEGFVSAFPGPRNPAVVMLAYYGDLGLDDGRPESVYTLDDRRLTRAATAVLGVGDVMRLPSGRGSLTFTGYEEWASFQVSRDPGKSVVLISAVVLIAGLLLTLFIRRRRLWVRARPGPAGVTVMETGGLGRTDSGAFRGEFAEVVADVRAAVPPATGDEAEERA